MLDENKNTSDSSKEQVALREGYQPAKRGYQPDKSKLDAAKPPRGGSGVPPKGSGDKGGAKKK